MADDVEVRVFCETEGEYKRITQVVPDPGWVPAGCETHVIRDFVIEKVLPVS